MASNDVLIRLVADFSDLSNDISSVKKKLQSIESTTTKAGTSITSTFKKVGTVVAGAFAVDKIKDFTVSMVEASASVNALDSMFTQTFKGEHEKALELITAQAQAQGIQVDRLKGTWASFYGTFKGNGADAVESLELTDRYMRLAGDGAAYYDMALEEVVSRLKSITMGNFEAGDSIGININATKMDTIAKEKYNMAWQDLNDTQKEFLLIDTAEKIYENSGAMGQGTREADSWSNVLENLNSVWKRLMGTLGQPVLSTTTKLVQNLTSKIESATGWVAELKDWFDEAYKATGSFSEALAVAFDQMGFEWVGDIVMGIREIIDTTKEAVKWFKEHETITTILASSIAILTTGIIAFNVWLKAGAISLKIMSTATTVWNTIASIGSAITTAFGVAMAFLTSPIGLITVAILGLVTVGILLYKNWDTVKAYAITCWETIKAFFISIWESISTYFITCLETIKAFFISIWESIKLVIETVLNAIYTVITTVWDSIYQFIAPILQLIQTVILAVWQGIQLALAVILTVISTIIKTAWEDIKIVIETIINMIKNIIQVAWNFIKTVTTNIFNSIKTFITTLWNGISSVITTVVNTIKSAISSAWSGIRDTTATIFNTIKSTISSVWNGIKSTISSIVNGISSIISSGFNKVSSTANSIFNGLKSSISSIWNGIGRGIQSCVNGIISVINGMVSAMNRISFDVPSWVPVMGGKTFGFNLPTIAPVSWFATGGIIKGSQEGTIVGVGENGGDEAIVPLSNKTRMKPFAEAVAGFMPDVDRASNDGTAGISINVEKLSVREEADVQKIAQELFKLQERNRRKRGV